MRTFFDVFTSQKKLFLLLLALPFFFVGLYLLLWEDHYDAVLTLNISREGVQTSEVENLSDEYDSFYRLGADEKFSDSVAEWLNSPRTVENILTNRGAVAPDKMRSLFELKSFFDARRMSAQIVEVEYKGVSPNNLKFYGSSIVAELNRLSSSLNDGADQRSWFRVSAQEPVVRRAEPNLLLLLSMAFVVGLSLAVLGTLFRYYYAFEDEG